MPIIYRKLAVLLKDKGLTEYKLKRDKVAGGATLDKIFGRSEGHVDTKTIESLCKYLDCQPGEIMEYVPDESEISE